MNIKSDIEIAQEHTPKRSQKLPQLRESMRSSWSCMATIRRRWISGL